MHELRRFISEHHMSVALATTIVDFVRQKRGPMAQRPLKASSNKCIASSNKRLTSSNKIELELKTLELEDKMD